MQNSKCKVQTWILASAFLASSLLCAACGSPALESKATPTPAKSPTPIPAEAVKVDNPVNVSFSTYSKDWPVGWQWIDPDEKYDPTQHDVHSGVLKITLTTKKNLNGKITNAPRYIKPISGDFQIETRVKFNPKENYQGAGLLIYKDDDNFLRFERAYGGPGGGGSGIRLDASTAGEFKPIAAPGEIQSDADEVEMKIVRTGGKFSAYWRVDEESEWREAGQFETDYPDAIMAGLIACNSAREVTASFAYIKLFPQ